MTRGRRGSLTLHRMTLSFTTPRRFIPAHKEKDHGYVYSGETDLGLGAAAHRSPAPPDGHALPQGPGDGARRAHRRRQGDGHQAAGPAWLPAGDRAATAGPREAGDSSPAPARGDAPGHSRVRKPDAPQLRCQAAPAAQEEGAGRHSDPAAGGAADRAEVVV